MVPSVFAHDGECMFSGIWTGLTAARSFSSNFFEFPVGATHWMRYTTGATAALTIGETLTGGTSLKTCTLLARVIENGATAGSGDAGVIFVSSPSGTFQSETLTGGTSTGTIAIAQNFITMLRVKNPPKAALITVETAGINFTMDGIDPTVTSGTNYGHNMYSGASTVIRFSNNIRKFKAINATTGAVMKYSLYY